MYAPSKAIFTRKQYGTSWNLKVSIRMTWFCNQHAVIQYVIVKSDIFLELFNLFGLVGIYSKNQQQDCDCAEYIYMYLQNEMCIVGPLFHVASHVCWRVQSLWWERPWLSIKAHGVEVLSAAMPLFIKPPPINSPLYHFTWRSALKLWQI